MAVFPSRFKQIVVNALRGSLLLSLLTSARELAVAVRSSGPRWKKKWQRVGSNPRLIVVIM